ncbi:MAG TPA: hypothetical protein VIY27_07890 [Myxococcota bacterium]
MTEHSILFSGPLVRALLDGSKTQTRRILKPAPVVIVDDRGDGVAREVERWCVNHGQWLGSAHEEHLTRRCPYGVPGDQLWVRETWRVMDIIEHAREVQILYEANNTRRWVKAQDTNTRTAAAWIRHLQQSEERRAKKTRRLHQKRPSIFMPRWASRLTLDVTNVRIERVQAISEEDARAEGVLGVACNRIGPDFGKTQGRREGFQHLWDSINAKRAPWASNPWVWCIDFKSREVEMSDDDV